MAATNFTPIQLYFSTTASAAPTAANLAQGELAINITDGKLYYEDNAGAVQVIATKGAGTIGGSTTQIQYNNAGALAGNAAMVFNNSTNVTTLTTLNLTNALGATYGGTAQSTYTQGDILYSSASNTLSKLGIGTVNYILTSSGSVPQWSAPSSIIVQTATNLAGGLAGSVPYQSALDTTTFLAIGAANRVMTSTGTAPQWVTALTGLTGVSSSSITDTGLTSGRVTFASTSGLLADSSSLTFNGTTLTTAGLSNSGLSTLVKTLTLGDTSFNGAAVFAPATPAKLYMGTGTVTDVTSAISATNTTGAIASLAITPIAATNTSVTYTNASTLYIAGAPTAGTNVTITNPYALYVAAGDAYFGGTVTAGTVNLTTLDLTNLEVTNIKAKDGTASITLADSTGVASFTANPVLSGGTANGVAYLNGSKVLTTGSALTFDGTTIATTGKFGITGNGSAPTATALQIGTNGVGSRWVYNAPSGGEHDFAINGVNIAYVSGTSFGTLNVDATIYGVTVGRGAGAVSTNTAVGATALSSNTTGFLNTAFGNSALNFNTTGNSNTAVGVNALVANTTGYANISIGRNSLIANTTGYQNIAIGSQDEISVYGALRSNTTGTANNAIGNGSLQANTTGGANTAVGHQSLGSNTTASNNTAVGYQAGYSNTIAPGHTAVGYQALYSNTTNGYATAIGFKALFNNTSRANVAIGAEAGLTNTSGQAITAVGMQTLYANTTGSYNVAVGTTDNLSVPAALYNNTTGSNNVAVGTGSLAFNTTASNNTAVGYQAGYSNTTGTNNTALGIGALYSNGTTSGNTAVGASTLAYTTSGTNNTAVGYNAGNLLTTGSKNTILGAYSGNQGGLDIRTANNNIVLSDGDGNWRWANRAGSDLVKTTVSGSWVASSWVTVMSNVTSLAYYLEITAYGYENGIVNSGINKWIATYSSAAGWTLVQISEATAGNTYGTPVLRFTGDTLETQGLTSVSSGRWFVHMRGFSETT